jgi:tape measure domain-containing protein
VTLAELFVKLGIKGVEEVRTGLKKVEGGISSVAEVADRAHQHVERLTNTLKIAAAVGGTAALGLGVASFQAAAKMDSMIRALATTSLNAEDLSGQLARLREVAKLPGLSFQEAVQGSLTLQQVGLSAQKAERYLKAFGNAAAAAGKGSADMGAAILQVSQSLGSGKLQGDELNIIAERIPQIRAALKGAGLFGTPEEIGKMGLSVEQIYDRIVEQLEKLPKVSGGALNTVENLMDKVNTAAVAAGRGFLVSLTAASPAIDSIMDRVIHYATQIGEVFASVANSGVLVDVFSKIGEAFKGLNGNGFQDTFSKITAGILTFVALVPKTITSTVSFVTDLFKALGTNAQVFWENFNEWASTGLANAVTGLTTFGKMFEAVLNFDFDKLDTLAQANSAAMLTPQYKAYAPLPQTKDYGFPDWAGTYADYDKRLAGARKPISEIPGDLVYGGGNKAAAALGGGVPEMLTRIEKNTRDTADHLALKRVYGGGEIGAFGATPAELMGGAGGGPARSLMGRGPGSDVFGSSTYAADFQSATQKMIRQEIAKALGLYRPATR